MVIGIVGIIYHRVKGGYGIGDRAIQFVGLCLIIPTILILSLENKFAGCELGTILGTVIGYTLSGIGGRDKKNTTKGEKEGKGDSNSI
jgi:hypothetical protein